MFLQNTKSTLYTNLCRALCVDLPMMPRGDLRLRLYIAHDVIRKASCCGAGLFSRGDGNADGSLRFRNERQHQQIVVSPLQQQLRHDAYAEPLLDHGNYSVVVLGVEADVRRDAGGF